MYTSMFIEDCVIRHTVFILIEHLPNIKIFSRSINPMTTNDAYRHHGELLVPSQYAHYKYFIVCSSHHLAAWPSS